MLILLKKFLSIILSEEIDMRIQAEKDDPEKAGNF